MFRSISQTWPNASEGLNSVAPMIQWELAIYGFSMPLQSSMPCATRNPNGLVPPPRPSCVVTSTSSRTFRQSARTCAQASRRVPTSYHQNREACCFAHFLYGACHQDRNGAISDCALHSQSLFVYRLQTASGSASPSETGDLATQVMCCTMSECPSLCALPLQADLGRARFSSRLG